MHGKIIQLGKKHIPAIAMIDASSGHRISKKYSVKEHEKFIRSRFKKGHEIFFGCLNNSVNHSEGDRNRMKIKLKNYDAENYDTELSGYASLKPFFPGHKHCELYWLSVKKQQQGKGIGKALLIHAEDFARKRGFRKLCLYTDKTNEKARAFYEHLGYKKINEFPEYYSFARNNAAVLYGKKL